MPNLWTGAALGMGEVGMGDYLLTPKVRKMTRTEHLLVILMEEAAEVQQRASKALRFGLYETEPEQPFTNAARIKHELADFAAAIRMLELEPNIRDIPLHDWLVARKIEKVEHFLRYSREQGTLTD